VSASTRYAVYLAPPIESELWRFGSRVLGRDAETGATVDDFAPEGYEAETWRGLVAEPRRYGFHATLKAPFRLNPAWSLRDLEARIATLARKIKPFDAGSLRISRLPAGEGRAFVALTLEQPSTELARLEANVVRKLDPLRAPPTAAEVERRAPDRLSPRQRYYLDAWGYPFVLDEFRLHFTLTGAVAESEAIMTKLAAAFERSVLSATLRVDSLALFAQDDAQADFRVVGRFSLGGNASARASIHGSDRRLPLSAADSSAVST
jgi:putative phosphonate metabolism protein